MEADALAASAGPSLGLRSSLRPVTRQPGASVAQIAKDLGISESCLRNWMNRADVDEGLKEGLSTDERAELVRLRRELRVKDMEIEILKRASAYFARENVLPK